MLVFADQLFRDIARKLNIPYYKIICILKKENKAYYTAVNKLFSSYGGVNKYYEPLSVIKKLLVVP